MKTVRYRNIILNENQFNSVSLNGHAKQVEASLSSMFASFMVDQCLCNITQFHNTNGFMKTSSSHTCVKNKGLMDVN